MLFGKTKLELKVGVFVFIGVVVLAIFVLSIGGFKSWSSGYHVKFIFNFVNGVKIGAPVRYAGVDVGQIKKINFIFPDPNSEKVEIVAWVKKEIKIPKDSTVWVNTLGLLGEKYVEVMPGKDFSKNMAEGEVLVGCEPIAMHEVAQLAKSIATDLDATILKINNGQGTIGKLITDDTIYTNLEVLTLDLKQHPWKLFWKGKE